MNSVEVISFYAALLMGLAGSAHCFGMCGGIAGALGMRARSLHDNAISTAIHAALYQSGRISGYAILGFAFGAVGQLLQSLLDLARISLVLRVAAGFLLLLIAARMLLRWNGLVVLERIGMRLWKFVQPLTRRLAGGGVPQTFMLGVLWGLLPCGMVYSMLAFAALSGSALKGAALMLAFGVGTVPAMFGASVMASLPSKLFSTHWAQRATGAVFVVFGVWMIAAPFMIHVHGAHVH